MSSIGDKVKEFFGFDKLIVVSIADLKAALAGNASDDVKASIDYAVSQVNRRTGSTILRHYIKAYTGIKTYAFAPHEWRVLVHEINFLTAPKRRRTASTQSEVKHPDSNTTKEDSIVQTMFSANKLESDPKVWFSTVLAEVRKSGNAFVKSVIKGEDDVKRILTLEGGYVNGAMVLNARVPGGSFVGPFQVGAQAWADGPQSFSKYKVWTGNSKAELAVATQKLIALNSAFAAEGPGDLRVMAPGIVKFWNSCWTGFVRYAKNSNKGDKLARVPRTVEMLYLLHNQGAGGAMKLFADGVSNPVDSGQSVKALEVGLTVKKQYLA